MKNLALFALSSSLILSASAQAQGHRTYDEDLAPRAVRRLAPPPAELAPDTIETHAENQGPLSLEMLREDHGALTPVSGIMIAGSMTDARGQAQITTCTARQDGRATFTAELSNEHFAISGGAFKGNYRLRFDAPCHGRVRAIFKSDSDAGQAMGIWQIGQKAKTQLEASIGLAFWRSQIRFIWPGNGDYYSFNTVTLTRGDHWDVVGHELGHAIYDQGNLGQFGGGEHKIDQCYGASLALSEGWASFFSAWLSVDLSDADAKFEYMVPRRAPIRFETIPTDVCVGPNSEWRVTGFFWDLIDLHQDGESSHQTFAKAWHALQNTHVASVTEAMPMLEKGGFDHSLLNVVWELNFAQPQKRLP